MIGWKTHRKFYPLLLVVLIFTAILARIAFLQHIQFDSDFGRDSLVALQILQGKFTLLGPQASVGGFYLGPFYFYLLAALYKIVGLVPEYASILFILMGVVTVTIGAWMQERYVSRISAVIFLLLCATNAVLITASRSATNQPMMPLVTVIAIAMLMRAITKKTWQNYALAGVAFGLFFHVHYSAMLLFPGYVAAIFFYSGKNWRARIVASISALAGMAVMTAPLALFELKHHFLLTASILAYISQTLHGGTITQNLPHLTGLQKATTLLSGISSQSMLGALCVVGAGVAVYRLRKQLQKPQHQYLAVLLMVFVPAVILVFLYRGYVFSYYLLTPITVGLLLVSTALAYLRPRLIGILLGVVLWAFGATQLQSQSQFRTTPHLSLITKSIEYDVRTAKPSSFTIFKDSADHLTGLGFEYRFLLNRDGYVPVDEHNYNAAQVLYVIREDGVQDALELGNWEVSQFIPKHEDRIATFEFKNPTKHVEVFRLTH